MSGKCRQGTEGTVCHTLLRLELQLEDLKLRSWNLPKDLLFPRSPSVWRGSPHDMAVKRPLEGV